MDLLAAGRSVTEVADDLGISGACIYNWRKQDRIDRRELPGLSTPERAELATAGRRIHSLEADFAAAPPDAAERRACILSMMRPWACLATTRTSIRSWMLTFGVLSN